MMKKTFATLTEDARESLLNVVADAVSELHRSKIRLGDDVEEHDESASRERDNGDFLYDFTRLNLQYLNQLANLGSNYSALGARALEKIHDYFRDGPEHDEQAELTVAGNEPTHVTLRVENPFSKRAKVTILKPILKSHGLASGEKAPRVRLADDQHEELFAAAGKTTTFEVVATADKSRVGKTYEFELPVRFASGSRTMEDRLKLKVRRVRS
jgi:hypothetical protein